MNKEILKEMSEKNRSEICAICLECLKEIKVASLDGCSHKYCHDCIQKWVTEVENTCPQCKSSIKTLTYKETPEGKQIMQKINQRRQDQMIGPCFHCNELINFADVFFSGLPEQ